MLQLDVRSVAPFKGLFMTFDSIKIDIGILDEKECTEHAIAFISAAEDLLSVSHEDAISKLCEIREQLQEDI